eukprot:5084025-Pyramimonas_sp.AAC.1
MGSGHRQRRQRGWGSTVPFGGCAGVISFLLLQASWHVCCCIGQQCRKPTKRGVRRGATELSEQGGESLGTH